MAVELKIEPSSDGTVFKQEELGINKIEEPTYCPYYEVIEYESQNEVGSLIPKEESIDVEDDYLSQTIPEQTAQCIPEQTAQCIQCKNLFSNETLAVENRCSKCNLAKRNDESDISGQTFSNDTDQNEDKCNNLRCKSCNQIFTTKSDLRDHLRLQCESTLICPDCGQMFERNWILKRHMRHHFNEKQRAIKKNICQLLCNHCNAQFANPKQLQSHYFKHGSECGFICVPCGRLFEVSNGLNRHMSAKNCKNIFKDVVNVSNEDMSEAHIRQEDVGNRDDTAPLRKIVKSTDQLGPSTRQKTSPSIKTVTQQRPTYKAFQYQSIFNKTQKKSLQKGPDFASILHDMAPDLGSNNYGNNQPPLETSLQTKATLKRRSNLAQNHLNTIVNKGTLGQHKVVINENGKAVVLHNNVIPEPQIHLLPIVPTTKEQNIVTSSNTAAPEQSVIGTAPPQHIISESKAHKALTKPGILNCKALSTLLAPKLLVGTNTANVDAKVKKPSKSLIQTTPQPDLVSKAYTMNQPALETTPQILQILKGRSDLTIRHLNTTVYKRILGHHKVLQVNVNPEPQVHLSAIVPTQKEENIATEQPVIHTAPQQIPKSTAPKVLTEPRILDCKARTTITAPKLLIKKPTIDIDLTLQKFTKPLSQAPLLINKNSTDVDARVQNNTKPLLQTTPQREIIAQPIKFVNVESKKTANTALTDPLLLNCKARSTITAPKLPINKPTIDIDSTLQKNTKPLSQASPRCVIIPKAVTTPNVRLKKLPIKDYIEQHLLNCEARSTINALKFVKSINADLSTKQLLQTAPQQMNIPNPMRIPRMESKNKNFKDSIEQLSPNNKAGSTINAPKLLTKKPRIDIDSTVQKTTEIIPKPITIANVESKRTALKDSTDQQFLNCKVPSTIKHAQLLGRNQSADNDWTIQKSTPSTDFEEVIESNHLMLQKAPLLDIDLAKQSTEEPEDFEQMIVVNFLPKNQMQNDDMENLTDENDSVL